MSQFFGPDSDQATPTSFEFYFNKGTTADNGPLTVYLDNVQAVSDSIWGLTGGGSIATASNFFGTAPNGVDAAVDFDNILGSASTITVGSATTLGTVRFNSSSTYTLSGVGPITLQTSTGSALIEADLATTQIINVPMTVASNATFTTQNGGAELTIASPLTVASGKSVTQSGPGMINYTSTISLQTGASLTFGNNTSPTALTLTTGSVATIAPHGSGEKILLQLGALNFGGTANSWQGQLDVADNDLIVHNANLSAIANQIRTGFNAGSGYWNGSGITSSVAHSNPSHLTTLGYGVGGSPFDGVNTTATDVLVKYTYYGDANLDGTVTGADYQQIDTGFGLHLTGWQNGDFNYDGVVDGSDYSLIDNTFNQITATGASALAIVAAPADLSSVPEPTTLALLAMGTIGVLGSRRRRDA
jgi:hypothetical protein